MKVYLSATMPDLLLIYGYGDEVGACGKGFLNLHTWFKSRLSLAGACVVGIISIWVESSA